MSWLKDFVEIPESAEELAEALTMAGVAVDGVEEEDGEKILELDITSNRPDAMNHFGLARDIAAIFRRPLRRPKIEFTEEALEATSAASIEIIDADLCLRYVGRVLLDVTIGPSPDWIRKRLELCGVRSINNIADLTNYVLLSIGHPTHAFDLDLLTDKKIIVRRAKAGETLITLDGVDRELSEDDLVIADSLRPVALAGVMGGLETEISDKTKNVLIEAAWFEPGLIRRMARRYGMHTEASHRFERGADWEAPGWAADRIAGLLGDAGGGRVLKGRIDVYPKPRKREAIELRRDRITKTFGAAIPDEEVESILGLLGFEPLPTGDGWEASAPTHRLDVAREIDLIEEVVRIHGYHNAPSTLPSIGAAPVDAPHAAAEARVRERVSALGYDETVGYSFIAADEAERFGSWPAPPLRNPLTEQWAVMRNSSVPTMLRALERNLNRNQTDVRLAELGRLYRGGDGTYEEPLILTLGATGAARADSLQEDGKPLEFYDLKSDVESLVAPFDLVRIAFETKKLPSYYVEGSGARVIADGVSVALLGEIDPRAAQGLKFKQTVFIAEIYLDALYKAGLRRMQHRRLPRTPSVHRDFSLFVPEGIPFAEVRAAVGHTQHLVQVAPVEVFRGKQVPDGYYSLLLRATWQKDAESLTDEEVNRYAHTISKNLEKKLGVKQRV